MAKIVGSLFTISGRVGNLVFSHNKGGAYVKTFTIPTNPQTPEQTLQRSRFGELSTRWGGTLTAVQRAGWELFSELFQITNTLGLQKLSGANSSYIGVNLIRLKAGDSILDDAPVDQEVASILNVSISAAIGGGNTIEVTFEEDCEADEKLYISGVVNLSPTINHVKDKRRFFGASALAQVSPFDLILPVEFGNLVTGRDISLFVSKYSSTNGAKSPGVVVEGIAS